MAKAKKKKREPKKKAKKENKQKAPGPGAVAVVPPEDPIPYPADEKKPHPMVKGDDSIEALDAMYERYELIKRRFVPSDFMLIKDEKTGVEHPYTRKGGWRKVGTGFGISGKIVKREKIDAGWADKNTGPTYTWVYYVRIKTPGGRTWEAEGACSSTNRFFTKGGRYPAQESDIIHMAQTCAFNRAISDMFGGETSAEEMLAGLNGQNLQTATMGSPAGSGREYGPTGPSGGGTPARRPGPAPGAQPYTPPPDPGTQQEPQAEKIPPRGQISKDTVHLRNVAKLVEVATRRSVGAAVLLSKIKEQFPKVPDYVKGFTQFKYLYPGELHLAAEYIRGVTAPPAPAAETNPAAEAKPVNAEPAVQGHTFGNEPPPSEPPPDDSDVHAALDAEEQKMAEAEKKGGEK